MPRVLLIGGAPMSGKSTAARVLADRHRRSAIATDDLGAAIRAVTKPGSPPMHGGDYREYYVGRTVERLWQDALESHRALEPAIEAVARMHSTWANPAVLEGWAILPDFVDDAALDIVWLWLIGDPELLEARVRADRSFWSGASDEEAMITKFIERSLCLDDYLRQRAKERPLRLLRLDGDESPDAVADSHRSAAGDTQLNRKRTGIEPAERSRTTPHRF